MFSELHQGVDKANAAYAFQVEAESGNEGFNSSRKEEAR